MKKKIRIKGGRGLTLLVGGAVGASVIGSAMPGTTGVPLQTIGGGFANFVGPATTLVGAGIVLNQLKHFPQPKKKLRRYRYG